MWKGEPEAAEAGGSNDRSGAGPGMHAHASRSEIGLHPDAVALLADLLVDASSRTELVVTTHSESLIAALTSQPEAIVACERLGAATTLRRLDPAKVASWLDEYSLGDMWRMGELGANP